MTILAMLLLIIVIYHHVGYPVLLKLIARYKSKFAKQISNAKRGYQVNNNDRNTPSIHIIVPAFNEESVIQQKINSIGWLDYPDDKLLVSVYCDGCKDETVARAIKSQGVFHNRELDIRIVNIADNEGKVSIINRAIKENDSDIIVFSDASAILSSDTLWRSAQHFMADSDIAVVTGDYSLIEAGSDGEFAYWQYQNKVRSLESMLGAVMGVAGAFYAIRREMCYSLEADTINDDFIMPMRAVELGKKAVFDSKIRIYETEPTPLDQDAQRRIRISQGNMQQVLRLKSLLLPGFDVNQIRVSWMFISGKFLRVLMPYVLIMLLILSATLALDSYLFTLIFVGQAMAYSLAIIHRFMLKNNSTLLEKIFNNKIVRLVSYLCQGHLMGLLGSASYLLNIVKQSVFGISKNQRWHKLESKK